MENRLWYAVLKDNEDADWGFGSFDKDEAIEMAKTGDCYAIAMIDDGIDPICIGELINGEDF